MIHAIRAGRKTQTRRPMYPQPDVIRDGRFFRADGREIVCAFGLSGDRLWVRERFALIDGGVVYAAEPIKGRSRIAWQKSRELPRQHSRLNLRVLSTRAQRLQEIDEADARAEGYDPERESLPPVQWFARLWDRLTGIEPLRWAANPWLWVVHFELIEPAQATAASPALLLPAASPVPGLSPAKGRQPRTATLEEKQRLAAVLRTPAS